MLTKRCMIDGISSSQGFISAVEHKTREVVELCSHYILARWDGLPMDEHHVTPLISEHLHLPYQPYMYPPYENASWLVRDLMNVTKTAYARAVLSSGVTMALDGTEVLCYPVKNVGVPMEAILYDFQIEEMMETATEHLKVKIYGLPLHLWTRRAIERALQPHCIVENVSQANLIFRKLRSVSCTACLLALLCHSHGIYSFMSPASMTKEETKAVATRTQRHFVLVLTELILKLLITSLFKEHSGGFLLSCRH